jgi:hypothetical protein
MHPRSSTSRREEAFPLARHFHPDHHDPDDRSNGAETLFSLSLSLSLSLRLCLRCFTFASGRVRRKSRGTCDPEASAAFPTRERETERRRRRRRRGWDAGERGEGRTGRERSREEKTEIEKRTRERERERETRTAEKTGSWPDRATNRRPTDRPEDPGHSPRFYKQPNTEGSLSVWPIRVASRCCWSTVLLFLAVALPFPRRSGYLSFASPRKGRGRGGLKRRF